MKGTTKKALADLLDQPRRTALVWASIFLGTAVTAAAFSARWVLQREVARSYRSAAPAAVIVRFDEPITAELVQKVRQLKGVLGAEPRRTLRARARIGPGAWRTLKLFVVERFDAQQVSKIFPEGGEIPNAPSQMLVERSSISVVGASIGAPIEFRVPEQAKLHRLTVSGFCHDPAKAPGWQDQLGYGFISVRTLPLLGVPAQLNELHVDTAQGRAAAEKVAAKLRPLLRAHGAERAVVEVPPRKHPHHEHMQAMLLMLQILSALSLLLACALAANLMAATLSQQTRQVGVMKALGGGRAKIGGIYLQMVSMVSVSAASAGGLLAAVISQRFVRFVATQLNLMLSQERASLAQSLVVVLCCAAAPVLACSLPIFRALRISPRRALQHTGQAEAPPRLGRWLRLSNARLGVLSELALRNTTRRPARTFMTLASLALGGAMLMSAANVYTAVNRTLERAVRSRGDNLEVRLLRPVPAEALRALSASVEGVKKVEVWGARLSRVYAAGQSEALAAGRYGVLTPPRGDMPPGARLFEGRWLKPQTAQVVINRQLAALEPRIEVGGKLRLGPPSKGVQVQVVGVIEELAPPTIYSSDLVSAALSDARAGAVRVTTEPGREDEVASGLEEAMVQRGWLPAYLMTHRSLQKALVDHFAILVLVIGALAVAALGVGLLGLWTTINLNVMERFKELGVLRTIGARRAHIARLLILEGGVIVLLSALLAGVISVPMSLGVGWVISEHGLQIGLPLSISSGAAAAWCTIAAVSAILSGWGPARFAAKQPIRALIAYE